jgi:hypothetical protein
MSGCSVYLYHEIIYRGKVSARAVGQPTLWLAVNHKWRPMPRSNGSTDILSHRSRCPPQGTMIRFKTQRKPRNFNHLVEVEVWHRRFVP